MAKLLRYTQQVFGSTAGTAQIAEFGSLAANAPATYSGSTITPAIVQTLSAYLSGWFSAIVGANSPAIEDMNSICYLFAYQIAYGMQAGIPEYDAGTTYYSGSLVNSAGTIYASLTNGNIGNAVTSTSNWGAPILPGVVTYNSIASSTTLQAGYTTTYNNLNLTTGVTLTVPSTSYLMCGTTLTVASGATLTVASGGTARVF